MSLFEYILDFKKYGQKATRYNDLRSDLCLLFKSLKA